ncbi:DMT family transporter [Hydrogenophaga aquatica]
MNTSVWFALGAAALFGVSTPLAKLLLGSVSPVLLGGLLYLGSGVGLIAARWWRDKGWQITGLHPGEWPWLAGAIIFGGVLGPVALMLGLQRTAGSTASLLLNLEAVLTAVLAWVGFLRAVQARDVHTQGFTAPAVVAGGGEVGAHGLDESVCTLPKR